VLLNRHLVEGSRLREMTRYMWPGSGRSSTRRAYWPGPKAPPGASATWLVIVRRDRPGA